MTSYNIAHLYIQQSSIPNAGNGVFTKKAFKKNDCIETASVLHIPYTNVENTPVLNYVFSNPYEGNEDDTLIVLGYGSMYNHSKTPNITYEYDNETDLMYYKAIRNIRAGEELFLDYGGSWWDTRPDKTLN